MADKNLVSRLNNILLQQLLEDLHDPSKCSPGLYQVIRGVVNDNRDKLDEIPTEVLDELTDMMENTPFKFGT
tara:strand:+ start:62 stop:277 length:216 start_codon:yes stop_codon:yes gene_type:complete